MGAVVVEAGMIRPAVRQRARRVSEAARPRSMSACANMQLPGWCWWGWLSQRSRSDKLFHLREERVRGQVLCKVARIGYLCLPLVAGVSRVMWQTCAIIEADRWALK